MATAQTPEALERLSWAAWWRDDADAVFEARDQALRAYRGRGDAAGAARMAIWLACDHLDFRGAVPVATGWLARARRLLAPLEPGREHGWAAFFEGHLALGAGDGAAALAHATEAAALGRRLGVVDLEMLGLALEGSSLVGAGEVGAGMRRLDEAAATALEATAEVPIATAWTWCLMVSACLAVRDAERASAWCERIEAFAHRHGSRYMLAFCRAEYGAVALWRGDFGRAEALLEAAVDDFARSRPPMVGGPLVALAELRRRQGRAAEAAQALERAGATGGATLVQARLALDRGDAQAAVEGMERLLRQVPPDRRLARAPALELLARGHALGGDPGAAGPALAALAAVAELAGTAPMRAAAAQADGLCAAAAGDHERARPRLEDAVDGFEGAGGPFEATDARLALAAALAALGRREAARREAAAALERALGLGAAGLADRARGLLAGVAAGDPPRTGVTARELDVLRLLADGLTNPQIAERLVLSEHTVHRHVSNILRKLGAPSRAAAAAGAVRDGLLDPPRS